MRLLLACLLTSALLAQTRVEGSVVSSPAGTPVPGVAVELHKEGTTAYRATTDAQGQFRIEGVAPGEYFTDFSKPGFRGPNRDSAARRQFSIAPGSPDFHLDVSMVPLAKLSGTVLGIDRHPIAAAGVQLFTVGALVGQTGTTDAKGNFSFENIDPGTYILSARAPKDTPPPPSEDGRHLAWVRTYYPSAPYQVDALKIPIAAGAELFGRDIQLQALTSRSMRGRVLTDRGDPAPGVTVVAAPSHEVFARDVEIQTGSAADGSFEFANLYDGEWRLSAQTQEQRASLAQSITGGDIDRVELRLTAPFSLKGRVVYEANAPLTLGGVLLTPFEGGSNIPTAPWDSTGSFQIAKMDGGTYKINALSGPAHAYLASIKLGDRDVTGQYVDIRDGSQPVTITYRSDGGSISGSVEDCGKAVIVLAPQETQLQSSEFLRQTLCRTTDHFELNNVRPGEYYAWAFDQPPGMLETSAFSEPSIVSQAVRVSVAAGQSNAISLKVTHRE